LPADLREFVLLVRYLLHLFPAIPSVLLRRLLEEWKSIPTASEEVQRAKRQHPEWQRSKRQRPKRQRSKRQRPQRQDPKRSRHDGVDQEDAIVRFVSIVFEFEYGDLSVFCD